MMPRARLGLLAALLSSVLLVAAGPRAQAVSISVTSATVNQPGDVAQVCVILSGSGGKVAGTQNDLDWDGNCATLPEPPPCKEVGSHGKQLSRGLPPNANFKFRGIMLSFGDVNPMPDGPMYCCNFQVEAEPGTCCPVTVSNASASDPTGGPIPASGNRGQLCTRSDQSGRGIGSVNNPSMNQPLSASNAPPDGGVGAAQPPPVAPPASGSARAPVAQVLQGGGVEPGSVPAAPAGAPGAAPAAPAAPAPPLPAAAPPTAPRPALAPPTAAVTAAAPVVATAAAPQAGSELPGDTPTRRAAAATHVPTRPAAAKAQPVAPAASEKGGGWFGCEIAMGASAAPVVGIGVFAALGIWLLRRRAARRR